MPIVKMLHLLFFIYVASSCSVATSVNQVKHGEMLFQGSLKDGSNNGVVHEFKRVSWYQELTMLLDVMVHQIKADDPFLELMDVAEKAEMAKCHKFYIVLLYSPSGGRVKNSQFWTDYTTKNVQKVLLGKLKRHLTMGPHFIHQGLMNYDILGACQISPANVVVQVPAFRDVTDLF